MQKEEIVEFGKKEIESERERKSLQPHIIINSACANFIDSAGLRIARKNNVYVASKKNPLAVFQRENPIPPWF